MADLLRLLASFDLVSPAQAMVQNATKGPSTTFLMPEACGMSGRGVEDLLRQNGVETWGLMIINRTLRITVRQAQARWAETVLRRARIPISHKAERG